MQANNTVEKLGRKDTNVDTGGRLEYMSHTVLFDRRDMFWFGKSGWKAGMQPLNGPKTMERLLVLFEEGCSCEKCLNSS